MALDDFEGLLDWSRLDAWLDGQSGIPGRGPVHSVKRLAGGTQNNVFLMGRAGGTFVLRRPGKHLRPKSNATMMREARVLAALKGSGVPHSELYATCEDPAVIGASFYIMAPLEGFSVIGSLPGRWGSDPAWRRAMGEELVRAAVALGAIDPEAVGLGDYGKAENWHVRQVERWRSQLEGYRELPGYDGHDLAGVDQVGRWLSDNQVTGPVSIIHGDYQHPNIMFSLERPVISGLIDWELSSLGDPLLDFGWLLQNWHEDGDPPGHEPPCTPWQGFLTRQELVRLYGELSGRDMADMPWFFVLACYKLACLVEGNYARSKAGHMPAEVGTFFHNYAIWLLAKAQQVIGRGEI